MKIQVPADGTGRDRPCGGGAAGLGVPGNGYADARGRSTVGGGPAWVDSWFGLAAFDRTFGCGSLPDRRKVGAPDRFRFVSCLRPSFMLGRTLRHSPRLRRVR
jgi:hypothetical protein